MKARDIIGRRIVAVRQTRVENTHVGRVYHLDSLELEGGYRIRFDIKETDDTPLIEAHVYHSDTED